MCTDGHIYPDRSVVCDFLLFLCIEFSIKNCHLAKVSQKNGPKSKTLRGKQMTEQKTTLGANTKQ